MKSACTNEIVAMDDTLEDLLLKAIRIEDCAIVSYAISKGANPNKTVSHGKTCLGEAATVGNIEILKLLISATISSKGPNKSPRHGHKKRPVKGHKRKLKRDGRKEELHVKFKSCNGACYDNQGYFVFIHGECSSSDESTRPGLKSPLSPVSLPNSPQAELEWDEEIGNVAPTTSEDETWTSMYKWYAAILESTGAAIASAPYVSNGIDQQDAFARTALHYAVEEGHADVITLLIEAGCKLDIAGGDCLTPLHVAIVNDYIDIVELLLAAGSNINHKTHEKMTPLHYAARSGHLDIVKLLLKKGGILEARDTNEKTALYVAAEKGHLDVVNYLISCGANVNGAEIHGYTPLCVAIWKDFADVAELLLNCGARVTHSHRLLHNAIFHKQEELVKLLTNCGGGGGINLYNDNGDTPLLLAVRLSLPNVVKILLSKGASVNSCNNITGSTALHLAVENIDDPDVFEDLLNYLLEYNVNMDSPALAGDTALNRALLLQKDHTASLLVRHGADVNICEQPFGVDNLSVASRRKNNSLASLILKAGHYQKILKPNASSWLHYACTNPLNLTDICRIKIRSLRRKRTTTMFRYISSLPLPNCMIRFLMLEDEGI